MLPVLLAAALLQADAAPVAAAPPPISAADAPSPDGTPRGAPRPDYDFVAWCHGALTGHMALYQEVKPELVAIEQPGEVAADAKNDQLQMQAGRDYLALYTRALNGVDRDRAGALMTRRKTAEAQGAAIWDPYRSGPLRPRMWAYVGWDLPGRCETAAKKMLTPAGRLAALHSSPDAPEASGPASIDDALGASAGAPAPASGAPPAPAAASPDLRGPQ